ncbi:MAG: DUF1573 domain-containing protein [Ginsengibacter sp.]
MKKWMIGILASGILFSCNIRNPDKVAKMQNSATGSASIVENTSVQMIDSVYDFGSVTDGENVVFSYRFKNTGSKPLVVSSATASCGCTVPEKPEHPILPGETGFLKVVFNSTGRVGPVHKSVDVVSNASPAFPTLLLIGEVKQKQ